MKITVTIDRGESFLRNNRILQLNHTISEPEEEELHCSAPAFDNPNFDPFHYERVRSRQKCYIENISSTMALALWRAFDKEFVH